MKRVFISGGAGFIGSHLTSLLLGRPSTEAVVVYDNFSSGTEGHLRDSTADPRLRIVRGEIRDLPSVRDAMNGCDTVFHLASNPDIAKAATEPDIDFWQGTYLTQNIIEAMRQTGVRRILYTSGSGVYGEKGELAFPEHYGPLIPVSTYAASKIAGEALICSYCHMFGLTAVAFRLANVVGPRQTHGVGYDFIRMLRANPKELRILGDGTQSKSYIHVDDVLEAMFFCQARSRQPFEVYNVATGDYITVAEIARLAVDVLGLDPATVRFHYTGGNRGWKGDVPVIRFDLTRIHNEGWRSRRNSREAIRDALAAMKPELADAAIQ